MPKDKENKWDCCGGKGNKVSGNMAGGSIYGLGFLGAVIYYFQHAASLQDGLWGLFKAIFWPSFLVYKLIEILKF